MCGNAPGSRKYAIGASGENLDRIALNGVYSRLMLSNPLLPYSRLLMPGCRLGHVIQSRDNAHVTNSRDLGYSAILASSWAIGWSNIGTSLLVWGDLESIPSVRCVSYFGRILCTHQCAAR